VPPIHRSVNIRSADLYSIENGIIIEHWGVVDQLNLLQQALQTLTLSFEILWKEKKVIVELMNPTVFEDPFSLPTCLQMSNVE